MKKFLTKTGLFLIPIILLFIPPFWVLKITGENYTNIDKLIINKEKYLIGYAYNENNFNYLKWRETTSRNKQDILALGSSRALQFRENMFNCSFYNAGLFNVKTFSVYTQFLKKIPQNKLPNLLIMPLDQWLFNENWNITEDNFSKKDYTFSKNASVNTLINVWSDIITQKYGFYELFNRHNDHLKRIGLNAVVNNKGFRNDGSFLDDDQVLKLISKDSTAYDFNYHDTYQRIQDGNKRFEYGSKINFQVLIELNNILSFCYKNNIHVVAYLPPYADKVNKRMKMSNKYAYIDHIYTEALPIFQKYQFELWDLTNLSTYESSDEEMIDGFHGGEVTYTKFLIYMVSNGSLLKKYTNPKQLKEDLDHKINNYTVYDYQ